MKKALLPAAFTGGLMLFAAGCCCAKTSCPAQTPLRGVCGTNLRAEKHFFYAGFFTSSGKIHGRSAAWK